MRKTAIAFPAVLALLIAFGCKDRDSDEYGFLGRLYEPSTGTQSTDGIYSINADTNRDGIVDPGSTDSGGEDQWNWAHGAVMLYNNDDDDSDGARDHANTAVDNAADESDLAKLLLKQIPSIDPGSYAEIAVDVDTGSYVRLFRHDGINWNLFDPASATISGADLAAGNVLLGIEACRYAETATGAAGLWSGKAALNLTVRDSGAAVLGTDALQIRTAPFLLPSNICTAQRMYICQTSDNASFISDMTAVCSSLSIPLTVINNSDRWTQDQFEIGFVDTPTGDNPVVLNSPRNPTGSTLDDYAWNYMLGPDFGCLEYPGSTSNSLNSFGNLDCIPPYGSYPLGRVIVGGDESRYMSPDVTNFLSAQSVQGPVYVLDTTWLTVGHVDEIMSFIPAPNARGWVIAWASPDRALDILQALDDAGHGSAVLYEGKSYGSFFEISVYDVLHNTTLPAYNDAVQSMLTTLKNQLKADLGLSDTDFVELPVLYYSEMGGSCAYTPGAANCVVASNHIIVADQCGPEVLGVDQLEADISTQLGALGLTTHYVDCWEYHKNMGEVHCGSNVLRARPAAPRWWSTGK